MTEVTLRLPDDLVEEARAAGLMTEQTIEALLREAIRRQAALRPWRASMPSTYPP